MKNKLANILSHPIIQVISFSIILVGSPYFGGPYLYFLSGSLKEGYAFGIIGMAGIALTLISMVLKARGYMQVVGLLLMILSLSIFFFSSTWTNAAVTILNIPALVTLLLFVLVSLLVTYRTIQTQHHA
jgi:hypothetical protein